jgi:hypothetical protein
MNASRCPEVVNYGFLGVRPGDEAAGDGATGDGATEDWTAEELAAWEGATEDWTSEEWAAEELATAEEKAVLADVDSPNRADVGEGTEHPTGPPIRRVIQAVLADDQVACVMPSWPQDPAKTLAEIGVMMVNITDVWKTEVWRLQALIPYWGSIEHEKWGAILTRARESAAKLK